MRTGRWCGGALLVLMLLAACLPGGGLALFVDDGAQSSDEGSLSAAPGEPCEASSDCLRGLRCLQSGDALFCVETCEDASSCDDSAACLPAIGEQVGWCDPAGVDDDAADDTPADDDTDDNEDIWTDDGGEDAVDDDEVGSPSSGGDGCAGSAERAVLSLVNTERTSRGLGALACHAGLARVARGHSEDMAARDYFDHITPEGRTPWDRMAEGGIDGYFTAGENIAWGYSDAAAVHEGWMNSEGHRANILGSGYTHVGIGIADQDGALVWTQLFAGF